MVAENAAEDGARIDAVPNHAEPNHAGRIDVARIRAAVSELLAAIGEDPGRPGLIDTPDRVAESYSDFFSGIGEDPLAHLADTETLEEAGHREGELVIMRGIDFRSMCEHHLLPFIGVAHIAYLPRAKVVGLGKLPRVVETLASRPQLQERLTEQVADAIETGLDALGVLVVLDAAHGCVNSRGTRQSRSTTVTLASRGALTDPAARAEAIALIGKA
jgi:GTP cyclohydrolase I